MSNFDSERSGRFWCPIVVAFTALALLAGSMTTAPSARAASGNGTITTVVGNGQQGYDPAAGDGQLGTAAAIKTEFVAVGPVDSPYPDSLFYTHSSESNTGWVQRILPNGNIERFAGGGSPFVEGANRLDVVLPALGGIDVAKDGTVYVGSANEGGWGHLYKITPGGSVHKMTAGSNGVLHGINGVEASSSGNVFIAQQSSVMRVRPDGTIEPFFGNPNSFGCPNEGKLGSPQDLALNLGESTLYVADTSAQTIWAIPVNNPTSAGIAPIVGGCHQEVPESIKLNYTSGVEIDSQGAIYWSASRKHRVYKKTSGGDPTDPGTLIAGTGTGGYSGDGGAADQAMVNWPAGLAIGSGDTLYVADQSNFRIRRVEGEVLPSPTPTPTTTPPPDVSDGKIVYARVGGADTLWTIKPDGTENKKVPTNKSFKSFDDIVDPEFTPNGKKIIFSAIFNRKARLHVVPAKGGEMKRIIPPGDSFGDFQPSVSPDGKRIAFIRVGDPVPDLSDPDCLEPPNEESEDSDGFCDEYRIESLMVANMNGSSPRVLVPDVWGGNPTWSPAGTAIAYDHDGDIYTVDPETSATNRRLESSTEDTEPAYSRDGSEILFTLFDYETDVSKIFKIASDGLHKWTHGDQRDDSFASFSPTGDFITFQGTDWEAESDDIWVVQADGRGERAITHVGNAVTPDWGPLTK